MAYIHHKSIPLEFRQKGIPPKFCRKDITLKLCQKGGYTARILLDWYTANIYQQKGVKYLCSNLADSVR